MATRPKAGDIFRQPALAETLRTIAKKGAIGFYEGPVAADMVATLRARGGLHTEEDFAAGRTAAHFVEPIHTAWRGYDVWQCPPNGSGLMVLMLLNILEGFEPTSDPLSVERMHRHVEAARLVYRDRDAFLADPTLSKVPMEQLMDPAYLAGLRKLIDPARAIPNLPRAGEAVLPPPSRHGLSLRGRQGRQRLLLHQLPCSKASAPASWRSNRASCCKTAAPASWWSVGTPIASPRTSARCTPSFPACSPRMARR